MPPPCGRCSDDADRVKAFGTVKRGREEIVDYLRGLFADGKLRPRRTRSGVSTPANQRSGTGWWRHARPGQLVASRIAASGRRVVADRLGNVPGCEHRDDVRTMRRSAV